MYSISGVDAMPLCLKNLLLNLTLFTIFFQVNEKSSVIIVPQNGEIVQCAKLQEPKLKKKKKNPDFVPTQNGEKVQCAKLQKWLCYKYK